MHALPNSRALDALKTGDQRALFASITTFGLLKPLEISKISDEMAEDLGIVTKAFPKAEYVILDGQRRYMALQRFLELENKAEDSEKESIEDRILLPCLVYSYTTFSECRRHSIEDNKFSIRPKGLYLDAAERLEMKGLPNIIPEEFSNFDKRMKKIAKEIERRNEK